jgi:hypothetical protein
MEFQYQKMDVSPMLPIAEKGRQFPVAIELEL